MLFITNRVLEQGMTPLPESGSEFRLARPINFVLENNQAEQSFYCCRRSATGDYVEIGSANFFDRLKALEADQLLFFIHGFSTLPEQAFEQTARLQRLIDSLHQVSLREGSSPKVAVIPLVWPCDNNFGKVKDYFDDQKSADASGTAYMRLLQKFLAWREENSTLDNPCLKRINVLSFSMGNRVLRSALGLSIKYYPQRSMALLFRNVFMAAADVVNDSLEPGKEGGMIPPMSRNVVAYYAADDLALRASKVANVNVSSAAFTRRLGHTGPEQIDKVPRNVYAVDCDDFNNSYDSPLGHAYFLDEPATGDAGLLLRHAWACMRTGRVPITPSAFPTNRIEILNNRQQV